MKKVLIVSVFILLASSCTKEQPKTDNKDQDIPVSEFQALKKEVEDLKATISTMTEGQEQVVSKSEFDALKQENDALKAQVEALTSTFIEVDGLRFDLNGEIISTPKYESVLVDKGGYYSPVTITRTKDAQGRLIEYLEEYQYAVFGYPAPPYLWKKITYEFNGKECRVTTQIHRYDLDASMPPEAPAITETTYW